MHGLALILTTRSIISIVLIATLLGVLMLVNVVSNISYIISLSGLFNSHNPYAYGVGEHIKYLYGVVNRQIFIRDIRETISSMTLIRRFVKFSILERFRTEAYSTILPLSTILANIVCAVILRNLTTRSALQALALMTRKSILVTVLSAIALISLGISLPMSAIACATLSPLLSNGLLEAFLMVLALFLFIYTATLIPLPLFLYFQNEFVFLAFGILEFAILVIPNDVAPVLFPSPSILNYVFRTSGAFLLQPLVISLVWVLLASILSWLSLRRCELY